jgi:uncharacterized protein YqgC (DUF456 family)
MLGKRVRDVLKKILGLFIIFIGILGLFLPIIPGVLLIIVGLIMINDRGLKRLLLRILKKFN